MTWDPARDPVPMNLRDQIAPDIPVEVAWTMRRTPRDEMPVAWVSISGFHDRALNGWLRANGRYWHFRIENEDEDSETYSVWDVPKAVRIPHLLHVRRFRHMVGWHMQRNPAGPWQVGRFDAAGHPNWRSFYDLPCPPKLNLAPEWRIGTTDLRTITMEKRQ